MTNQIKRCGTATTFGLDSSTPVVRMTVFMDEEGTVSAQLDGIDVLPQEQLVQILAIALEDIIENHIDQ